MSRNSKNKKKSTSKYRQFKVSPLIPVIAVVEAVVLIVISTYAWYYLSSDKEVSIGTISVDADSGLDIDFKYAKEEDYINLWNYIDRDFAFEPVTSLDGRNVFVPTSGTFDNTNTSNMIFREGTVNDINSKYINIDFELTNTTDYKMKVFLNNNSYFRVKDTAGAQEESRALRLAFYPNDGSTGKVNSQLIGSDSDYSGKEDQGSTENRKIVYFDDTKWDNNQASKLWNKVYAYIWDNETQTPYAAWPGIEMSQFSGPTYSFSFTDTDDVYDKILFHSGEGNQTSDLNLTDNGVYSNNGYIEQFVPKTVYFVKPTNWEHVYVHAWRKVNGSSGTDQYYTSWSGTSAGLDEMKSVGSGIYSYTFNGSTSSNGGYYSGVNALLFTNGSYGGYNQTQNITVWDSSSTTNDKIYYCNGKDGNNVYSTSTYGVTYPNLTTKTVYFYNSLTWSNPYMGASVTGSIDSVTDLPMTTLNGNVYYCNVPEIYNTIYFHAKGSVGTRTVTITHTNGYVYRTVNETDSTENNYYKVNAFPYSDYIDDTGATGYAVISPGVSTGFQRTYTPIISINNETGHVNQVIPAFANSIDNYIYGNTAGNDGESQTVFEIESKHVLSLSLVIWLEGTDPSCTGDAYPGNNIELRLEFASSYTDTSVDPPEVHEVNTYGSDTYTYKFYDKTREVWTSDRQDTESGVTVAPVMQLYDNTIKRGYLMTPDQYTMVDGVTKVSRWTVDAPKNIATWGHDIIFRRVNPYDEDEVWNYWHAGRVAGGDSDPVYTDRKNTTTYTPYSEAFTNGTTISFTAFADGSPTAEVFAATYLRNNAVDPYNPTAAEIATAKTQGQAEAVLAGIGTGSGSSYKEIPSCGGLWGNHSVRTLTVVDGLNGHPCKNDHGILTMAFQYSYKLNGSTVRTVTTEFKASGPNSDVIYYFVIPDAAYTSGASITFKNYTGYNDNKDYLGLSEDKLFAINSDRNNHIWFKTSYTGGAVKGDFFELNEERNGTAHHYWGSDILYIETTSTTDPYCYTYSSGDTLGGRLMQVHYTGTSQTSDTYSFYSFLYLVDNSDIKGNGSKAFISVVPNNHYYDSYRVESCSWSSPSDESLKFYMQSYRSITHSDSSQQTDLVETVSYNGASTTFNRCHLNNENICILDYFTGITVYFQTNNTTISPSGGSYAHLYKDGGSSYTFPGEKMTPDGTTDNGHYKYHTATPFDVTKYNKVIFNGGNDSSKTAAVSLDLFSNGDVYECDSVGGTPGRIVNANNNNILATRVASTANPHYVARS